MGYVFPRFEIFSGSSLGPVAYTKHDSTTFCHVRSRALLRGRPLFALPRAFQKKDSKDTLFLLLPRCHPNDPDDALYRLLGTFFVV